MTEWQRAQIISSPPSATDFSYSAIALQSRQYTNFVAVENAVSMIPGRTSLAMWSMKPFEVLMTLWHAGQPGTTTPLPPWAIEGGLSTKCSHEWRFNSRCAVRRIDDIADLWIIWREERATIVTPSLFSTSIILPMGTWPEPKPCKRKWGRAPFDQMLRHIREDKCEQCRKMVLYFDREATIELYLRQSRN
jgi:hypothetical protein